MTDITELAQSLKAAAIDAKELAIIARYSKGRAAAEKFYALANPNNVIALVEALEKAQAQSSKWLEGYHKAVSIGARYEERIAELEEAEQKLCAANVTLYARAELAERRLAEMESRTVTVKLPESFKLAKSSSGLTYYYADEVDAALTYSGIKVEAE
ncbi:TPA: hypothetical protein NHU26_004251 [Klebsiella pneumoniae]|nr:hypothetical protein [Klebsiella pneumoniae]